MMDTPSDDTDALRKRHSAGQRLVAILLCAFVVVGSCAGVVLAQSGQVEGFEDGTTGTFDNTGVAVQDSFHGEWSLKMNQSLGTETFWTGGPSIDNHGGEEVRYTFKTDDVGVGGKGLAVRLDDDNIYALRSNGGNWILSARSGGVVTDTTFGSASTGTWYEVLLTAEGGQIKAKVWQAGGTEPASYDATVGNNGDWSGGTVRLSADQGVYLDRIAANTAFPDDSLSGRVTDREGDGIEDATVETNTSVTATTNETGYYSMDLVDGTYNLTAYKDDYVNDTANVTIDGNQVTRDFTLVEDDSALQIKTRLFIEHGETVPYEIIHGKADGTRENVTASATVTSNNTSVLTVDTTSFELNATSDESVNQRTYITATYTRSDGETLTQTQNVTVANKTVANLDILPPVTRFAATLDDKTIQTILIATGVGVAAAILATSFAGIAAVTLIMVMGWVMGIVPDGLIMVTVLTAMFIGMNVAGNVDYTVRR